MRVQMFQESSACSQVDTFQSSYHPILLPNFSNRTAFILSWYKCRIDAWNHCGAGADLGFLGIMNHFLSHNLQISVLKHRKIWVKIDEFLWVLQLKKYTGIERCCGISSSLTAWITFRDKTCLFSSAVNQAPSEHTWMTFSTILQFTRWIATHFFLAPLSLSSLSSALSTVFVLFCFCCFVFFLKGSLWSFYREKDN